MGQEDCAETCFDLLLIEMLQYYGSFDKGQPGVAQGVEVHSGRERSSTLRSTIGAGAGPGLGLGLGAGNIADGMESMGFQVGCQLGERYSKNRAAFEDTLDIVKFLCKDFWTEVFRKQIDNLKTNHRGVFVLYDSKFRWLRLASVDQNGSSKSVADLLRFPCGLIRGALFTLGIKSVVSADVSSSLPACSFMVKITQNNSKTNA